MDVYVYDLSMCVEWLNDPSQNLGIWSSCWWYSTCSSSVPFQEPLWGLNKFKCKANHLKPYWRPIRGSNQRYVSLFHPWSGHKSWSSQQSIMVSFLGYQRGQWFRANWEGTNALSVPRGMPSVNFYMVFLPSKQRFPTLDRLTLTGICIGYPRLKWRHLDQPVLLMY